jgi:micrococcal nuclease
VVKLLPALAALALTGSAAAACISPVLSRVLDGDTIVMKDNNYIRMVGIDAPERGQCGYDRATDFLNGLLEGRVGLERDRRGADRDRYGRALRYVTANGLDVNYEMVRSGMAEAYTTLDFSRRGKYVAGEASAKLNNLGLWSACGHP